MDYIKKIETHDTGGGCTVDFLYLDDGRVVGINDESICLYENIGRFHDENGCIDAISIPRKQTVSYDFQDGQLVELCEGRPAKLWDIHTVPDDVLRAALSWNDKDGDFAHTPRVHMLEVFLSDFIQSKRVLP